MFFHDDTIPIPFKELEERNSPMPEQDNTVDGTGEFRGGEESFDAKDLPTSNPHLTVDYKKQLAELKEQLGEEVLKKEAILAAEKIVAAERCAEKLAPSEPVTFQGIWRLFIECKDRMYEALDLLVSALDEMARLRKESAALEMEKQQVEQKAEFALIDAAKAKKKPQPEQQLLYKAALDATKEAKIPERIQKNKDAQEVAARNINVAEWQFSATTAEMKVYEGGLRGVAALNE